MEERSLEEGSKRRRQCLTMILKDELKENPLSVQRKKEGHSAKRQWIHKSANASNSTVSSKKCTLINSIIPSSALPAAEQDREI